VGVAAEGESLWEFLHHRDDVLRDADGRTLTPLLIFDQFEEIEQALVYIQKGHVAAGAAGKGGRGDLEFHVGGGIHCCSFASAAVAST
jgi:hypothetical protein